MRFAIMGAGALGTILAVALAKSGHQVQVVARAKRLRQIKDSGLVVAGLKDSSADCEAFDNPKELSSADVLVLAVKSQDNAAAVESVKHMDVQAVFSVANGVLKRSELLAAFPEHVVLGCMADISGELLPDGVVRFTRNVGLYLGQESDSDGSLARPIVDCLCEAGIEARFSKEIAVVEWSKFVGWVGLVALSVLSRLPTWQFLNDPGFADVLIGIVRESAGLAEARGIQLIDQSPIPVATIAYKPIAEARAAVASMANQFRAQAPDHLMSSLQDLNRGRVLEHEATLGFAVAECRRLDFAAPNLEICNRLVAGLSRTHS